MELTNRIYDAFENIRADEQQKEATKRFLREKSRSGGSIRPHHLAVKYAVSAVCAMLILVIGGVGFSWVRMPVSYVSIDVNPSIELGLNRFDRVVSVEAYNAEGEAILSGLPLKWKRYTEAIDAVIGCEEMKAYLTDTSELVLTVVADSAREAKLTAGVKACTSHVEGGCHNMQADINMAPQAHQSGLSCGKYNAYLRLSRYDSSITIEDCQEMSMAQLQEKLREYETGSIDEGTGGNVGDSESNGDAGNEGSTGNAGDCGSNGDAGDGGYNGNAGNNGTDGYQGTGMNRGGDGENHGNGHGAGNGPASDQRGHHHRGGSHE